MQLELEVAHVDKDGVGDGDRASAAGLERRAEDGKLVDEGTVAQASGERHRHCCRGAKCDDADRQGERRRVEQGAGRGPPERR